MNRPRNTPRTRRRYVLTAIGLCGIIASVSGCAHRMPAPTTGPPGSPRVGWVIMTGDRDSPDHDFVCQSNPRSECVVPHSQPDGEVFSHLHFYFHPASTDMRYSGSIRLGFFKDRSQELKPDLTVKAGDDPGNHSIVGIVTDRPGAYTMDVAVEATAVNGSGGAQRILENVQIVVK